MSRLTTQFMIACSVFVLCATTIRAEDSPARLTLIDHYSTAFAGEKIAFRVQVTDAAGSVVQCAYLAGGRTVSRQETVVKQSGEVEFTLTLPPIRDGVTFKTNVVFTLIPDGATTVSDTIDHPLFLFPANPVAGQRVSLQKLNIQLYDPDGKTEAAFQAIDLPYMRVRSLPEWPPNTGESGILVIGESLSLRRQTELVPQLFALASHGMQVVLLAPRDGQFDIPGLGNADTPTAIGFRRADVIRQFDNRFDATSWVGAGAGIPFTGLTIESSRGRPQGVVSDEPNGWPWIEIGFRETGGSLTYCGFHLIEHWNAGPTPRFLLIRLLDELSP